MNKKFWKNGDPFVWLTGVALMFSLLMIAALLYLIAAKGLGFFWPADIAEIKLKDGHMVLGEITGHERIRGMGALDKDEIATFRTQVKTGNRDLYGLDFRWISDDQIESISYPEYAVALERREWGNMYGFIKEITESGSPVCSGNEECWPALQTLLPQYLKIYDEIRSIEKGVIGRINAQMENLRLDIRRLEMKGGDNREEILKIQTKVKEQEEKYKEQEAILSSLYTEFNKEKIVMASIDGREKEMPLGNIVRAYRPNDMNWFQKASL